MKRSLIPLGIGLGVGLFLAYTAQAGHAEYNFDTDPTGYLDIDSNLDPPPWRSSGGNPGGYLAITDAVGSQRTVIRFDDFDNGMLVKAFSFTMDIRMGNGTSERPADGMSVCYARANDPIFQDPTMWTGNVHGIDLGPEGGTSTGLSVCFDAWEGNPLPDGSDIEGIIVRVDDVTVLRHALPTRHGDCEDPTSLQTGPRDPNNPGADPSILCWQPLSVELDEQQKLTVKWKGATLLDHAEVAYFPSPGRLVLMGRTGGSNQYQHVDNIVIDTIPASTPTLVEGTGEPDGITLKLQDAPGSAVDPSSVQLKVNGQEVTAEVQKQGDITTIHWSSLPDLLPGGELIPIEVAFKDTQGNSFTATKDIMVIPYTAIPEDFAVSQVDTSKPGFNIRPYQTEEGNPNSLAWTEEQLAGLHGPNLIDLNMIGADALGYVYWSLEIDFKNQDGGNGNFDLNYGFDWFGVPAGSMTSEDNTTLEILAYVYFPQPGLYTMGVNSDDGFRVQTYYDPRDKFAVRLGEFDSGRGAADTIFNIYIPKAGYYPMRLLYENGGGGAAVEWFTVTPDGTKHLINDMTDPDALQAYAFPSAPTVPYVINVTPGVGARDVRADTSIQVVIQEVNAAVDPNSVQMTINDEAVTPQVTRNAGKKQTTIFYQPDQLFESGSTNTVTVVWAVQGQTPRTNTWQFVCMPYVMVPTDLWSPIGSENENEPGFLVQVFQVDPMGASNGMPHSPEWAEALIAGGYYQGGAPAVNIIDDSEFTPEGYYIETETINYNQDGEEGNAGNFTPDKKMPGIPGLTDSTDNFACAFTTYVVFPEAGLYLMGVNSDDGFRTSVGDQPGRYAVQIEAPADLAGQPIAAMPTINGLNANFGGPLPWPPVEGDVVYVGTACDPIQQDLTGKIALIDRGDCAFVDKCRNAQQAGALAAIVVNATEPLNFPILMGGSADDITIPCLMINNDTGDFLKSKIPGLRLSVGADPNVMLGQYYGDRGSSDTIFAFVIQKAGVYPLRTVYWEGSGGANVEWFTVTKDGKKVLLNDPNDPDALKCYRSRTFVPKPTVKISKTADGKIQIEFTGTLQSADEITGPWTDVQGATSPYIVTPTGKQKFYRAKQ